MCVNSLLGALLLVGATTLAGLAVGKPSQDPVQPAPPAPQHGLADLRRLAWLSGTWAFERDGVTTEEHWRPVQGTTLLGSSHTYDPERTRFFEHLRIALRKGTIAYVASPGGATPTTFVLKELGEGVAVFENPAHDHPQRIRYERTEQGITATIAQLDGTRAQSFVFERR
ncbi:MAG: hypothetical protein JNK02_04290 [Planctomycetes bacterium]|nr:hypothetical protein [Planctomycetota bacterium]